MGGFMIFLCSVLSFGFILCILLAIVCPQHQVRENLYWTGFIGLLGTVLLGWGVLCSCPTYEKVETLHKPHNVFRSKRLIVLVHDDLTVTTDKTKHFDKSDDMLFIKKVVHKNAYGLTSADTLDKYEVVVAK